MLTVTCFNCGHTVSISPDAERCSICGSNLRRLLKPDQEARYFYDRAADMAATGNVQAALQEVQRGLAVRPSSELCLLGAILCKRLNRLEDMRRYVAAIPVDDALRGEAEWLLRSSQARQRVPVALDEEDVDIAPSAAGADLPPLLLEEVKPSPTPRRRTNSRLTPVLWLAAMVLALVGGWWVVGNRPELVPPWIAEVMGAPAPAAVAPGVATEGEQPAARAPGAAVELEPTPPPPAMEAEGAAPAQPASAPQLPVPTPEVPADLVQAPAADGVSGATLGATPAAAALAGDVEDLAARAAAPSDFEWTAYLQQMGAPDLAALPVTARADGKWLILEGTVETAEQRARIGFIAGQAPGFEEVSIVNVLVKLPAEYEVQANDTLWDISVRLYGDASRIDALFAANQDVLPSRDALQVGMKLKVPQ
jgi:nucleoid-associated protein YgaU